MKRTALWALSLAVPAAVVAALAFRPAATDARPASIPAADSPRLPVNRVVLFSSGVGYFQREGVVDGDARVDLTFPASDINDLIKSLTLQDLDGGLVSAVNYDSHDPVERTLKSFAVDMTGDPSEAQLLQQARGEKVEVVLNQPGNQSAGTLTGTIVGIEMHKEIHGGNAVTDTAFLNLWCVDGLRSVKLADAQRVRFLNPVLESEYRRALDTLALSHDAQKKAVSLQFTGRGRRNVRVGYVTESPVWKTSYRLNLRAGKDAKPELQGWAVVENPTDEDWNGVRMALVSGRPISFKMDLYPTLYAPRPTVEPELFASLRPQTYDGDMEGRQRALAERVPASEPAKAGEDRKRAAGLAGDLKDNIATRATARVQLRPSGAFTDGLNRAEDLGTLLGAGVASAATAERLGESFQYRLEHPVNLPRQKSALLPIVTHEVDASRISVYNPAVHAKYPLLGLRLKNSTGVNLMQGPITVFDGGVYAGDARIMDMQPNDDRLLTYAVDLGAEVVLNDKNPPNRITAVTLKKGLAYTTTRQREERTYHAINRSTDAKTLVIEHPYRPTFRLANNLKPAERTRDQYRFELSLPAGKTGDLEVIEEQDVQQAVQLTNSNNEQIRFFLTQQTLSSAVRAALEKSIELRGKLATTQRQLEQVNRQIAQITADQVRLRENLKATPETAAAYKRYVDKLDKQEVELESLQARRDQLQNAEHEARTAYEGYLMALNVE
jgi:hypothetical protein